MSDSVAQDQLQSFFDRINRLHDEKDAINADISEIYREMRGNGFDTKVMKRLVADSRKDAGSIREFETIYQLYAGALGLTDLVHAREGAT